MKKIILIMVSILMVGNLFFAHDGHGDEDAIKKVILSAYRDGLMNKGDVEAIKKGFDPGFNLLGLRNNSLTKWPIAKWIESTEKKKAAGKFPPKELVSLKFPLIDITGSAAVVKLKFFRGKALAYTDYLSLYKFKEGWKIVNKIYHSHK